MLSCTEEQHYLSDNYLSREVRYMNQKAGQKLNMPELEFLYKHGKLESARTEKDFDYCRQRDTVATYLKPYLIFSIAVGDDVWEYTINSEGVLENITHKVKQ